MRPKRAAEEAEVLLAAAECGRKPGGGVHHVRAVLPKHLTAGRAALTTTTHEAARAMHMRLFLLQLDVDR